MDQQAILAELGLPDRAGFYRETAALIEAEPARRFALLVIDTGGLDDVLATMGPAPRDGLFRMIASRLANLAAVGAQTYHIGSDRFALRVDAQDGENAMARARGVIELLREAIEVEGVPVLLDPAMGVVLYPEHAASAEMLARQGVAALQMAKQGGVRVRMYDLDWDRHQQERFALLADFARAVGRADGGVHHHLQPIMRLADERCVRAEALVRWDHPERGLLSAGQFVPHLEGTALFRPMTRRVLETVLTTARRWREEGHERAVCLNLSPYDLEDPEFGDQISDVLEDADSPAHGLEFEITESAVLDTTREVRERLETLRATGAALAIDDFGTGYSSLKLLASLPFDTLKIDKSLIAGAMRERRFDRAVRSTIALGHDLGMTIVAEGIEDADMAEAVGEWGCDCAQGFHYARPMPEPDFESWLAARRV